MVEEALRASGARFVANDCRLSERARLWLVTGPNMGGKSTFLRQNALIAVLAQAGCYVPATGRSSAWSTACSAGSARRTISRAAARPSWSRWSRPRRSSRRRRRSSFVILDEVGRGTSTYDGLAIAWAVVEAIHDRNRCRCLFATHYHELTRLAERLDALSLHHVRAREWKGDLVLLHEVATAPPTAATASPSPSSPACRRRSLARAKSVLAKLEAGPRSDRRHRGRARRSAAVRRRARRRRAPPDPLHAALAEVEPDCARAARGARAGLPAEAARRRSSAR